jgi:hypothetical protein
MTAPSLGLTSYSEQLAAYAGMIADLTDGARIVAARNSESSTELRFGSCVIRDSDSLSPTTSIANVKYPAATSFRAFGLIVHSHGYDNGPNGTLGTSGVKPDGTVNVMRRGLLYVETEDACTEGAAAFVRHTANSDLVPGNLRSDADSAKADEVVGIIWRTTRADAGLALVEVDMIAYDADKNV